MTPDELRAIWMLVSRRVCAAQQTHQPKIDEDADADRYDVPDGTLAAGLPWTGADLRAHYEAAATALGRAQWDPAVAAATAMCCLGGRTEPPMALVDTMAEQVAAHLPPLRVDGLLDIATAFGCGWSREIPRSTRPGDWSGHWSRAMTRLGALIERQARATISSLHRIGVLFPSGLPDAASAASLVLHALVDPVGRIEQSEITVQCLGDETAVNIGNAPSAPLRFGARMVFQVVGGAAHIVGPSRRGADYPLAAPPRSRLLVLARVDETRFTCAPPAAEATDKSGWQIKLAPGEALTVQAAAETSAGLQRWVCSCGHRDCHAHHRLAAWNPALGNLEHFLRVAVSGVSHRLQAGQAKQFATSVLGARWATEGIEE